MRGLILGLLIVLFLVGFHTTHQAGAEPPPVPSAQPRSDTFEYAGYGNLQPLNPVTVKAKSLRTANFRLTVLPGCNSGSIPSDISGMIVHAQANVSFILVRNDVAPDFTVFISCGNTQITKCGSVNVFCLPDGFPYNANVYISDVLSTWPSATRLSILLHEIIGHAVGTWNEQYATCAASCGFAPSPGWVDFMNTGPDSRVGFTENTLGRWERTMWPLTVACTTDPCWDGAVWTWRSGWKVNPSTDQWFDPLGRRYWNAREPWGGRCSDVLNICEHPGVALYDRTLGDPWIVVP